MILLNAISSSRRRAGAFDPLSLSPSLWFKDTGSNLGQWDDFSGNGYHVTQATVNAQPQIVTGLQNGRQVRRFDGTNNILQRSTFPSGISNCSMFAVMKWKSGGNNEDCPVSIGSAGMTNSDRVFYRYLNGTTLGFETWANGITSSSINLDINGAFHVFSTIQLGAAITLRRDGVGSNYTLSSVPNATTAGFSIGGLIGSTNYFSDVDIGEVLIYPTALSDTNRNAVETYLTNKWFT